MIEADDTVCIGNDSYKLVVRDGPIFNKNGSLAHGAVEENSLTLVISSLVPTARRPILAARLVALAIRWQEDRERRKGSSSHAFAATL